MPRLTRRAGPIGIALTLVDVWRKIPKEQRRALARQARKHGPSLAKRALRLRAKR